MFKFDNYCVIVLDIGVQREGGMKNDFRLWDGGRFIIDGEDQERRMIGSEGGDGIESFVGVCLRCQ